MDEAVARTSLELFPIGVFQSDQVEPYEAGRQPDQLHASGVIQLDTGHNFEQAMIGLESCPRLWVIFQFHHNPSWNPMVLPPRGGNQKIGVFATRSPYRPNGIGMSCVEIIKIDRLKIFVAGADILDGSPILDLKPYIAYADSFPGVMPGWLEGVDPFVVSFSSQATEQIDWLKTQGVTNIFSFLNHQLEYEPTNSKKKRVKALDPTHPTQFVIAYRTWRAVFEVNKPQQVVVVGIFSGYSDPDLAETADPYSDKDLHRQFRKLYPR